MFAVLRGELIIREECNGVAWNFPVKLDARRKRMDRHIGIIPELYRQDITCEMPGRRRDECGNTQLGPGRSEPFQHFLPPPPAAHRRASAQHQPLELVLFRTLGQTCDDLVVCAQLTLTRAQLKRATSMLRIIFGTGGSAAASKATNSDDSRQARAAATV
jgi:hypothetical protein